MNGREGLPKPSEPDKVDAYMKNLKHPLAEVANAVREILLKADADVGEEHPAGVPKRARVNDESGSLEGNYPDGRRLALFHDMREVQSRKAVLQRLVKQWLVTLDKG